MKGETRVGVTLGIIGLAITDKPIGPKVYHLYLNAVITLLQRVGNVDSVRGLPQYALPPSINDNLRHAAYLTQI